MSPSLSLWSSLRSDSIWAILVASQSSDARETPSRVFFALTRGNSRFDPRCRRRKVRRLNSFSDLVSAPIRQRIQCRIQAFSNGRRVSVSVVSAVSVYIYYICRKFATETSLARAWNNGYRSPSDSALSNGKGGFLSVSGSVPSCRIQRIQKAVSESLCRYDHLCAETRRCTESLQYITPRVSPQ